MAENIYWILINPIFGIVIALIIAALQIAGVINMKLSRLLLFVAWLVIAVGAGTYLNKYAHIDHRIIAALMAGIPSGIALFILERWMTKKVRNQEVEERLDRERKDRETAQSLKGLVAKAENFVSDYLSYDAEMKLKLYSSFNKKAVEWQQEVENFVTSNFPTHYFDSLKFDEDYTPGGVNLKIKILQREIEKLESGVLRQD